MSTNTSIQSGRIFLAAAVPPGGTVTLPYPTGTSVSTFTGANAGAAADNVVYINDNDRYAGTLFTIAYGAAAATITNNSTATWPANGTIRVGYALLNQAALVGGKGAAIPALTDNSGGVASNTVAAITDGPTKNAIASILAVQALILAELKQAGVTN